MAVILFSATSELIDKYQIPSQLVPFIDDGFLVVATHDWAEKYVEFCLPSKTVIDTKRRVTSYSAYWIHPDFNEECCHYFEREPGDLPHFYAVKDTTPSGAIPLKGSRRLMIWQIGFNGCGRPLSDGYAPP